METIDIYISLETENEEEADKIFYALSDGGIMENPIQNIFCGDYFGNFTDKFGVGWMVNFSNK